MVNCPIIEMSVIPMESRCIDVLISKDIRPFFNKMQDFSYCSIPSSPQFSQTVMPVLYRGEKKNAFFNLLIKPTRVFMLTL